MELANITKKIYLIMEVAPETEYYQAFRKKHYNQKKIKRDKIGGIVTVAIGVIFWLWLSLRVGSML